MKIRSKPQINNRLRNSLDNGAVKLEIVADKIVRTDSIDIQINYFKKQTARKLAFTTTGRRTLPMDIEADILKLYIHIKDLSKVN